ncbi:MAG: MFS transporter [Bradyrhizobiaceae bacterium]|nr:MAG: MFS transporter [Bradyrhizobiaceae bacterium]
MTESDSALEYVLPTRNISVTTVALASLVGTTIEWYDFFIFSSLSAIVFNDVFFPSGIPLISELLAYGTFAAGFLVRPLGGVLFGHFGDRIGRKQLLIFSLAAMGLGTFLIGLLPTFSQVGIWAPLALLVLRCLQGLALGGEWGGAVLMTFEYADPRHRTLYASFPQIGLALGLFLSTATIAILSGTLSSQDFLSWGWRIPFIASVLLLIVGLYIRSTILETPEFEQVRDRGVISNLPIAEVVSRYGRVVLLGLGSYLIMGVVFSAYCVYGLGLMTKVGGIPRTAGLTAVALSALLLLVTIPAASILADRIGKKPVYLIATIVSALLAFPVLWSMTYSESPSLVTAALLVAYGVLWGPLYGPQAALFCELFDARLRYTGISLIYQIGSVISISLTPIVATALYSVGGSTPWLVAAYVVVAAAVSAVCVKKLPIR